MQAVLEQHLSRVARGDKEALQQLYEDVSARLYGIVMRIVKNDELADQTLEEVFIDVWSEAHRFDASQGAAIVWLNGLARDRALAKAHRSDARFFQNIPIENLSGDQWNNNLPDSTDEAVEFTALSRCMDQLGPEVQTSIIGVYCEGLTQDELSQTLHQPVGMVNGWVRQGLVELKGCLDSDY